MHNPADTAPGTGLRFAASLALVVAVLASCKGHDAGDACNISHGMFSPDPCASGTACLATPAPVSGIVSFCTAATPCKADSDCPSHFGCSAIPNADTTATYCATSCTTSCGSSYGCPGCAAGYGCAADGVSCELRLGKSCFVTDTSGPGCGNHAACSATTRVCTLNPPCETDSDCGGGFTCSVCDRWSSSGSCTKSSCVLSCVPPDPTIGHANTGCAPGFACNPQTLSCSSTLGGACDPGSDDETQCGVGGACSAESQTCVAAMPCNSDDECSGYGCLNGYCLFACTKNLLPCTIGKTCDLSTHTCG